MRLWQLQIFNLIYLSSAQLSHLFKTLKIHRQFTKNPMDLPSCIPPAISTQVRTHCWTSKPANSVDNQLGIPCHDGSKQKSYHFMRSAFWIVLTDGLVTSFYNFEFSTACSRSTLWFGIHRVHRDGTLWKRRLIDWSHLCSRDPIKGIALCSVCTRLPAGLGMLVVHPYNWLMHACIACIHELSENMEIQKLLQHSMAASVEKRLRDDLGTPKVLKRDSLWSLWFHSNPPRANTSEKFQKHPT